MLGLCTWCLTIVEALLEGLRVWMSPLSMRLSATLSITLFRKALYCCTLGLFGPALCLSFFGGNELE